MTVIVDSKKRVVLPPVKPGERFEVADLDHGRILLTRLAPVEVPLVRAVKVKGRWMGNPSVKFSRKAIVDSIRQDREER
jgi:hypothetical protein